MSSEEKILEGARKIGEKYAERLRAVAKNPDLDLSSEYRKISEDVEKKLDVYLKSHEVTDSHLRTSIGELVFTKILLKVYQEVTGQK